MKEALGNILPGEKQLCCMMPARAGAADWLIGMNLTRLYTLKARDSGVSEVLSVGRVQTPTLAMVVNRDNEITSFVPKPRGRYMRLLKRGRPVPGWLGAR